MTDLLAADTAMGAVTLSVANLDVLTAYYRDSVALTVLSESSDTVVLGRGTTPVVILTHSPALTHANPRDAGLFHTAILFDSEEALAASVYSVATRYPKTFTGSAVFVSAGGYHHHMAMNTWNLSGAGPRLPALGLAQIDITVPKEDDLGALGERMTHHGIPLRHDGQTLSFDDPWANQIRVSTAP